jgi:DNA polymerase
MRWAILTPRRTAYWNGSVLSFGRGATRAEAPDSDALETFWRTYYASIFNPARLKIATMQAHMPKRYWANLPEAPLIGALIQDAPAQMQRMVDAVPEPPRRRIGAAPLSSSATARAPADALDELRTAASRCRNCALWEHATQTVFGEGPAGARVMFVGEQPGDREDLVGRPFVGPAGQLFDRALAAAGIDRGTVYITNAVKHFKFEVRGKRRLHRTPRQAEMDACIEWFERELETVDPALVVCMGVTAMRAVTSVRSTLESMRGRVVAWRGRRLLVTLHPSAILRTDPAMQQAETERFFAEVALAAAFAAAPLAPADRVDAGDMDRAVPVRP